MQLTERLATEIYRKCLKFLKIQKESTNNQGEDWKSPLNARTKIFGGCDPFFASTNVQIKNVFTEMPQLTKFDFCAKIIRKLTFMY